MKFTKPKFMPRRMSGLSPVQIARLAKFMFEGKLAFRYFQSIDLNLLNCPVNRPIFSRM